MSARRRTLALLAAGLVASIAAGCSDDETPAGGTDVANDTQQDVSGDVSEQDADAHDPDVALDAEPDTAPDTEPDVAPDIAPDTEPDVAPDTAPDTTPDVVEDALPDTAPDVVEDALPDTAPDVAPDTAPDTPPDVPADATPDAVPDVAPDAAPDTSPDVTPDTGPASCGELGGICVSDAAACSSGGGTRAPEGDLTCDFSDGLGACCVPPEAQATGDTCASRGGLCAPIGGCNFVDGSFGPPSSDCGSVPVIICCLPESTCGEETDVCCGDGVAFRPTCDRGTFTCDLFPGTTLRPEAECTF